MARTKTPSTRTARTSPIARVRHTFTHVSDHASEHEAVTALQLTNAFTYILKYNTGRRGLSTVYRCTGHTDCGHVLRVRMAEEGGHYVIEEAGEHGTERSDYKRTGILPAFLAEIDAAPPGHGPKKILKMLERTYRLNAPMLAALPTEGQIKNRRAYAGRKDAEDKDNDDADASGGPSMMLCELYEWAGGHYCTDAAKFLRHGRFHGAFDEATLAALDHARQKETLVLSAFRHDIEGSTEPCVGLIFTSRRLFSSVLYTVNGQRDDGIIVAAERVGELDYGWVLIAIGTYRTNFTDAHGYRKRFVPWAYLYVSSEHKVAYEELFRTVTTMTKVFDVDLVARYVSLDSSAPGIVEACKAVWPDAAHLDCFARMSLRCEDKRGLLSNRGYYERQ